MSLLTVTGLSKKSPVRARRRYIKAPLIISLGFFFFSPTLSKAGTREHKTVPLPVWASAHPGPPRPRRGASAHPGPPQPRGGGPLLTPGPLGPVGEAGGRWQPGGAHSSPSLCVLGLHTALGQTGMFMWHQVSVRPPPPTSRRGRHTAVRNPVSYVRS